MHSRFHDEEEDGPQQQKRKTIDPVYPPKEKKNEIASKIDAAMEIEEDKNSSKFGVPIYSFNTTKRCQCDLYKSRLLT